MEEISVYNETKTFLLNQFGYPPKETPTMTDSLTKELYNTLFENFQPDLVRAKRPEIKQAFEDIFQTKGKVSVIFKGFDRIGLKVLPYKLRQNDCPLLPALSSIIEKNEELIEYPYNGRDDQVFIPPELVDELFFVIESSEENVNTKELIKTSLKKSLELGERDLVLFKQASIIIKIFQKVERLNSQTAEPKQADKNERRFNGYDPKELDNIYKELFEESGTSLFLSGVFSYVTANSFTLTKLTNERYEQEALQTFLDAIAMELKLLIDNNNDDYIEGLSKYIFRLHFFDLHKMLAEKMIELYLKDNINVKKFIEYYNGATVFLGRKRYQLPEILDANGNKWNSSSLHIVAKQFGKEKINYKLTKNLIVEEKKEIKRLEEELDKANKVVNDNSFKQSMYKRERDRLDANMGQLRQKNYELKLSKRDPERVKRNAEELRKLDKSYNEAQAKFDEIKMIMIKADQEQKKLSAELNSIRFKLKQNEKKEIDQKNSYNLLQERFDIMIDAFAKALTKRKKIL